MSQSGDGSSLEAQGAEAEVTVVWLDLPENQTNQGAFADAIGSDEADAVATQNFE